MQIDAYLDFDASPADRAIGTFVVIELIDENGNDVTHLARDEVFFSVEQLRRKLDLAYGMPISAVNVQTED